MDEELYFEDFYPGQTFDSEHTYWLTAKEIIGFGERYDPQPFHIDETAGQNSFFHGLAASGWLTAAIAFLGFCFFVHAPYTRLVRKLQKRSKMVT